MQQPGSLGSTVKGDDELVRRIQSLERQVRELAAANPFAPMGMFPKSGGLEVNGFIHSLRTADGSLSLSLDSSADAFIAYDSAGNDMVRVGKLAHVNVGSYGIEVKYNGSWLQVGGGNVDWGNISNKPATYAPSAHTHAGSDVTSQVSSAAQADGSSYGFNNNVGGTTFYAVWVGNDGGFHFGRNTSSIRYKTNVREHYTDPANVLALTPVLYDRLSDEVTNPDGTTTLRQGAADEFGLIAEQVYQHFPELVTWFEGKIDGIRYDLLSVALLSVVKSQEARIEALEAMANKAAAAGAPTGSAYVSPTPPAYVPNLDAGAATAVEAPLPFTIQPQ